MFVVVGATGNTGSAVAETLLAGGAPVRVVGRSAERLQRFVEKGAEGFVGDVTDVVAMVHAFPGAAAAYLMIPPDTTVPAYRAYQEAVGDSLVSAIKQAGVKYVVSLSSVGAHLPEKTGPIAGLHYFEKKLNSVSGLNVLHLRPGWFMENLFYQSDPIRRFGMMAGPERGEVPLPWIATRDIGAYAAERLLRRDFTGVQTRELLGPRDVTLNEIASVVGRAIGRPRLKYRHLPGFLVKLAAKRMGISRDMARLLIEMADAVNKKIITAQEKRSKENTTPTPIEQFVEKEFVPRYEGRPA